MTVAVDAQRLDKWLWYARFFKSRTRASAFCSAGKVRVNAGVAKKANHALKIGDVLTFPQGSHIRVVRVENLGTRRGPSAAAQTLYDDLEPPMPIKKENGASGGKIAAREARTGRPTKAQRRATDKLRRPDFMD